MLKHYDPTPRSEVHHLSRRSHPDFQLLWTTCGKPFPLRDMHIVMDSGQVTCTACIEALMTLTERELTAQDLNVLLTALDKYP